MLWGLQQLQVTIIVKKRRQKDTFDPMLDWPGSFFSGLVMLKRCTDRYTRKERCVTIQIIPWMRSVTTLKPLCMWWWYSVHILWMRNFWKFTGLLVVGLHHGPWPWNFAFLREVDRIWNRIESKYMYGCGQESGIEDQKQESSYSNFTRTHDPFHPNKNDKITNYNFPLNIKAIMWLIVW